MKNKFSFSLIFHFWFIIELMYILYRQFGTPICLPFHNLLADNCRIILHQSTESIIISFKLNLQNFIKTFIFHICIKYILSLWSFMIMIFWYHFYSTITFNSHFGPTFCYIFWGACITYRFKWPKHYIIVPAIHNKLHWGTLTHCKVRFR